jgi:serine/threonine protein kinase
MMVTGIVPWTNLQNISLLTEEIKHGKYRIPRLVSDSCRNLIRRMMDPDPETRIRIEEVLTHPWVLGQIEVRKSLSFMQLVVEAPRKGRTQRQGGLWKARNGQGMKLGKNTSTNTFDELEGEMMRSELEEIVREKKERRASGE